MPRREIVFSSSDLEIDDVVDVTEERVDETSRGVLNEVQNQVYFRSLLFRERDANSKRVQTLFDAPEWPLKHPSSTATMIPVLDVVPFRITAADAKGGVGMSFEGAARQQTMRGFMRAWTASTRDGKVARQYEQAQADLAQTFRPFVSNQTAADAQVIDADTDFVYRVDEEGGGGYRRMRALGKISIDLGKRAALTSIEGGCQPGLDYLEQSVPTQLYAGDEAVVVGFVSDRRGAGGVVEEEFNLDDYRAALRALVPGQPVVAQFNEFVFDEDELVRQAVGRVQAVSETDLVVAFAKPLNIRDTLHASVVVSKTSPSQAFVYPVVQAKKDFFCKARLSKGVVGGLRVAGPVPEIYGWMYPTNEHERAFLAGPNLRVDEAPSSMVLRHTLGLKRVARAAPPPPAVRRRPVVVSSAAAPAPPPSMRSLFEDIRKMKTSDATSPPPPPAPDDAAAAPPVRVRSVAELLALPPGTADVAKVAGTPGLYVRDGDDEWQYMSGLLYAARRITARAPPPAHRASSSSRKKNEATEEADREGFLVSRDPVRRSFTSGICLANTTEKVFVVSTSQPLNDDDLIALSYEDQTQRQAIVVAAAEEQEEEEDGENQHAVTDIEALRRSEMAALLRVMKIRAPRDSAVLDEMVEMMRHVVRFDSPEQAYRKIFGSSAAPYTREEAFRKGLAAHVKGWFAAAAVVVIVAFFFESNQTVFETDSPLCDKAGVKNLEDFLLCYALERMPKKKKTAEWLKQRVSEMLALVHGSGAGASIKEFFARIGRARVERSIVAAQYGAMGNNFRPDLSFRTTKQVPKSEIGRLLVKIDEGSYRAGEEEEGGVHRMHMWHRRAPLTVLIGRKERWSGPKKSEEQLGGAHLQMHLQPIPPSKPRAGADRPPQPPAKKATVATDLAVVVGSVSRSMQAREYAWLEDVRATARKTGAHSEPEKRMLRARLIQALFHVRCAAARSRLRTAAAGAKEEADEDAHEDEAKKDAKGEELNNELYRAAFALMQAFKRLPAKSDIDRANKTTAFYISLAGEPDVERIKWEVERLRETEKNRLLALYPMESEERKVHVMLRRTVGVDPEIGGGGDDDDDDDEYRNKTVRQAAAARNDPTAVRGENED